MSLFTETVTVENATVVGRDDYGNDVTEWVGVESPAWLEQTNSTENTDNQEQTTANMRLYVPLWTAIDSFSRVIWGGFTWSVNGEPGRQPGGFIVEGFQIALISRTEG